MDQQSRSVVRREATGTVLTYGCCQSLGGVEACRQSHPPDDHRFVFPDRSDFLLGGTSAAAAHYGSELDEKIT